MSPLPALCMYLVLSIEKRVVDPLELKLQVVLNPHVWVLGIELLSSGRAAINAL